LVVDLVVGKICHQLAIKTEILVGLVEEVVIQQRAQGLVGQLRQDKALQVVLDLVDQLGLLLEVVVLLP
jgi:DNA helicase TIP49 (TBP-interacting protein)